MFKKKSSWNLYGSCFLILGLQVVLHNFAEFPGLWKLNFDGIIKGKVTNLRIPGGFSKNISSLHSLHTPPPHPTPPPFGFFLEQPIFYDINKLRFDLDVSTKDLDLDISIKFKLPGP